MSVKQEVGNQNAFLDQFVQQSVDMVDLVGDYDVRPVVANEHDGDALYVPGLDHRSDVVGAPPFKHQPVSTHQVVGADVVEASLEVVLLDRKHAFDASVLVLAVEDSAVPDDNIFHRED